MKHKGGRPRKAVSLPVEEIPHQDFFTVQEAAALTNSHIHTIQARLREGTLKGKKLGKSWRIYRESLVNPEADISKERDSV